MEALCIELTDGEMAAIRGLLFIDQLDFTDEVKSVLFKLQREVNLRDGLRGYEKKVEAMTVEELLVELSKPAKREDVHRRRGLVNVFRERIGDCSVEELLCLANMAIGRRAAKEIADMTIFRKFLIPDREISQIRDKDVKSKMAAAQRWLRGK
ncbi:MAG: hypothetical protein COX90_03870 [Candidatus Nealsonbacteria bacterium CG_4_10_14_0_2_um_filter_38_17]|uniref:Uncharacterized protein n=2 Tax=Candidatus Nealsoniibacteriota TaxID=1817911 RepID=A0A2M7UX99_9BACT|nr:MAG: hypothetical protein COX36_00700 [Candidatus Nealsonbacteria bacterium CG23_combo_of_CG06-09_8_20_14_all_38_19]PIZ88587.1 MAG: hypothetical protein COX90_03870 [Candidatus Nealsonbacteria bacterium CG_4_10_14_0_2_um_filter_38_17]